MTEQEHALLQAIKSAVKSNPDLFGMAVMYMNAGVKEVQDCGYLDEHRRYVDGYSWTSSITFVPDPEHKWEV